MSDETIKVEPTTEVIDEGAAGQTPVFTPDQDAYMKTMLENMSKENQSEVDRRVKFMKENSELKTKLEDFQKSQMTKEEQTTFEFAEKEAALKEQQEMFLTSKLSFEKLQLLNERGLPKDYLDVVSGDTLEKFAQGVEMVVAINKVAIDNGIKSKLLNGNPKPVETTQENKTTYTFAEVKAMSPKQVQDNLQKINESQKQW